jgi:hypothetical protein
MLKFLQFIKEANISGSKSDGERHFSQYIEPWLPGNPRHGESHKLGTAFSTRNQKIPAGTSVSITGHAGVVNGVHHVHVETEQGETATIPVTRLQKPAVGRAGKNPEEVEDYQIDAIHSGITKHLEETGKKEVPLHLPDGTVINVAGARKVVADDYKGLKYKPKADVIFYDKDNKPVHYGSLKGYSQQQYGGVSHLVNHPIVKNALETFKNTIAKVGRDAAGKIKPMHYTLNPSDPEERKLIHQSMFGKEHGNEYGLSNVQGVYTGNISVKPAENGRLTLTATKSYSNKENSEKSDIDRNVSIFARHAKGRRDAGMQDTRIIVSPKSIRPNAPDVREHA